MFCWREVEWRSDILGLRRAHLVIHICVYTAPLTGEWTLNSPRCEVGNGFVFEISLEPGSFKAFEKRRNAVNISQRSGKSILGNVNLPCTYSVGACPKPRFPSPNSVLSSTAL